MAEALGWEEGEAVTPARGSGMTERHGERKPHPASGPAPTVIGKSRSWSRIVGHRLNDVRWVFERPSTTVVGSFRPDVIAAPGYRIDISRQNAPGSVRVDVWEAAVLQSFRADYPWQGSRTKRYEQVGNAVPPRLAAHVLAALGVGMTDLTAAVDAADPWETDR